MAILVGTASWAEKSLIDSGLFYPPTAKTAEARLRYYASVFPLVEADSSYYAIPSQATVQRWVERTPADFKMNVKAFRFLTGHMTEAKVLPAPVRELLGGRSRIFYRDAPEEVREALWHHFILALEPLRAAGKLGLVHFQFPPSVVPLPRALTHIEQCVDRLRGLVVSIEFRHRSWWDSHHRANETLAWLRRLGAVHTVVDGPQGAENSVPAVWESTHDDFALVRLHGRNAETYNAPSKTAGERFDYDYNDDEIEGLVTQAVRLDYKVRNTHLIFNNCDRDKGQRNGMTAQRTVAAQAGQRPDLSGWNPPNGFLGQLSADDIGAALSMLPPAESDAQQYVDVEIETGQHGRVRVTCERRKAAHRKSSHMFWAACFAKPI